MKRWRLVFGLVDNNNLFLGFNIQGSWEEKIRHPDNSMFLQIDLSLRETHVSTQKQARTPTDTLSERHTATEGQSSSISLDGGWQQSVFTAK